MKINGKFVSTWLIDSASARMKRLWDFSPKYLKYRLHDSKEVLASMAEAIDDNLETDRLLMDKYLPF